MESSSPNKPSRVFFQDTERYLKKRQVFFAFFFFGFVRVREPNVTLRPGASQPLRGSVFSSKTCDGMLLREMRSVDDNMSSVGE